jgi:serine/threonine protein kinase
VILTPAGRAVLVDFGIAAVGGGHSRAGTAGYAAPEGPASPAADVFGLAATAFALLSGEAPGAGARAESASTRSVVDAVASAGPQPAGPVPARSRAMPIAGAVATLVIASAGLALHRRRP